MANFYMLIGIPGCGKSTWAEQHKDSLNAEILSSDRIREEHFGDVNDQSHNAEVFTILSKRTHEYLNNGINVIYDATNVNRRRRVNLIKSLPENTYTTAILFATPFVNCCERNNLRDRKVPEDVMWKFYKTFQAPWYGEGFHDIYIEYDEKLAKRAKKEMQTCFDTSRSIPHDNPHHTATIGDHMDNAYNYAIQICEREHMDVPDCHILEEASLWHDIGKVKTKVFTDMSGNPTDIAHFYFHANVSAYDYLCSKCYNLADTVLYITNLINNHMVFFEGAGAEQKIKEMYDEHFYRLLTLLHECDVHAD